jgi:hypothetical protein
MLLLPSPSRYAAAPLISDLICLISYITIAYHIPGTLLRILPLTEDLAILLLPFRLVIYHVIDATSYASHRT